MMTMQAGELRERMTFQKRPVQANDGYGNTLGDFEDQFTVWAAVVSLTGGSESIMAARLEGTRPVVITVRQSDDTEDITTDWRAVDAREGTVYNIRGKTPDPKRRYFDILCEAGVAT